MTQGRTNLLRFLSDFQLYGFARLGKINFWIVLFYILLIIISPQIVVLVFLSSVFPGVSIPKNIGVSIGVIVIICFLNIYFLLHYL